VLASVLAAVVSNIAPAAVRGDDDPNVIEDFHVAKNGDWLIVPVAIDGREFEFMIDTGATCCVVDTTLRSRLTPTGKFARVNGTNRLEILHLSAASVGASCLPVEGDALCIDFSKTRKSSGHDIRGVLGMTFLREHVLRIDFDLGRLSILRSGPTSTGEGLKMSYDEKDCPTIAAQIGNWIPTAFKIDTGMIGPGKIESDAFDALNRFGFLSVVGGSTVVGTAFGEETRRNGLLHHLRVGAFAHEYLRLNQSRKNALGLDFLSRHVVTFDFPNDRLYLSEGKRFGERARFDASGLALIRDAGDTIVERTCKGSPSREAGIKNGTRLIEIDGKRIHEMTLFELERLLEVDGKRIQLVIDGDDGPQTIELLLADWQRANVALRRFAAP
jgi:hypothetical protein